MEILGPVKEYDDTNDTSIVLRIDSEAAQYLIRGVAVAVALSNRNHRIFRVDLPKEPVAGRGAAAVVPCFQYSSVNVGSGIQQIGGLSGALNYATVDLAYCPVTEYNSKVFRDMVKSLSAIICPCMSVR